MAELTANNKRIVNTAWILVTAGELAVLAFFVYRYMQLKNIRNIQKLSKDDASQANILSAQQTKIKYYYEFPPGVITDNSTWLKEKVVHYINQDSIVSGKEYTVEKPERTYRIVAMGDSFIVKYPI